MKKTAISIFALLVLGVSYLFLFSQQSYKKTVVQYYANDQNLPNRITYSEYSDKREANYGGTLNIHLSNKLMTEFMQPMKGN